MRKLLTPQHPVSAPYLIIATGLTTAYGVNSIIITLIVKGDKPSHSGIRNVPTVTQLIIGGAGFEPRQSHTGVHTLATLFHCTHPSTGALASSSQGPHLRQAGQE